MAADPADPTETDHQIASCTLDRTARAEQEARYRSLAGAVSRIDRTTHALTVQFDERLDRALLGHALDVERRCCPFFVLRFDDAHRRLTVGVRRADDAPALDVLAAAFTPTSATGRTPQPWVPSS